MKDHQQDTKAYYAATDIAYLDTVANEMLMGFKDSKSLADIIVTIPAHNEEEDIVRCIESLAYQESISNIPLCFNNYEVVVLCHKCTDSTYNICKQLIDRYPSLNLKVLQTSDPYVNNVGAVRRILMNIAYERLNRKDGFIATTDADTIVDRFWIANIMAYLGNNYGMICGKIHIDLDGVSDIAAKTIALKENYFLLVRKLESELVPDQSNPYPRHSDNSGPNLAIRGDVYKSIGGINPIGFCEDIALYDNVLYHGYKVRHCLKTLVTTSSRRDTRTPWGFGAELRTWEGAENISFEVESLKGLLARIKVRNLIKQFFSTYDNNFLEKLKQVTALETKIEEYLESCKTESAFIHRIEKSLESDEKWCKKYPKQVITSAYQELRNYMLKENLIA